MFISNNTSYKRHHMKLLLVEDNQNIASALSQALATTYTVDWAGTASFGLSKASQVAYDIIVLDLNLPDMQGLEVCRRLRRDNHTMPILILTAEVKPISKINLLDAGADDYLTKPFSLGELKARLRVLLRRTSKQPQTNQLAIEDLTLDTDTHTVTRAGKSIRLRRKEFFLLECLLQHAGSVVTREALSHYAWRENEDPWTNTIDVHIKYLRDKIDRPFAKPLIKTVHGLGYKLETTSGVAKT